MKRSLEQITKKDLRKLLKLARQDIDDFFDRNPTYKRYQGKEKLIALCQGAALHYIDKKNGVKDFDVWIFYAQRGDKILPYRRTGKVDYGKSKFGNNPNLPLYDGRNVDVLMRSSEYYIDGSPELCLKRYLTDRKTRTAKLLSEKAVIGLFPPNVFGKVLWYRNLELTHKG